MENKNIIKILVGIIGILLLIIGGIFILPKYNQTQKDLGKIDLINEMIVDNKIAVDYLNCNEEIDWETRKESYKAVLITQPQINEENLIQAVNQIIDNEKKQCKTQNIIIYYQVKGVQ